MDDLLYREEILELIREPKNLGVIKNPDLEARLDNPLCGDEVWFQVRLKNGKVKEAKHSGGGCAISQASADLLAQNIEGKSLAQVQKLETNDIIKLLGINPSPARMSCALLSLETLKKSLIDGKIQGQSR